MTRTRSSDLTTDYQPKYYEPPEDEAVAAAVAAATETETFVKIETDEPPKPLLPTRQKGSLDLNMPDEDFFTPNLFESPPPPWAPRRCKQECPVMPPQSDGLDLTTLGWILLGTFVVGTMTGALSMKAVSSKAVATAAAV